MSTGKAEMYKISMAERYAKYNASQKKREALLDECNVEMAKRQEILSLYKEEFLNDIKEDRYKGELLFDEYGEGIGINTWSEENGISADKERPMYWLDEIENEDLYRKLTGLNEFELMIIDDFVYKELNQEMIARKYNMTQSAVSKKMGRIRRKLMHSM